MDDTTTIDTPTVDGLSGVGNDTKEGEVAGAKVFYPRKLEPVIKGETPGTDDDLPSDDQPTTDTIDTADNLIKIETPSEEKAEHSAPEPPQKQPVPPEPKAPIPPEPAAAPEPEPAPEADLNGLPKGPYKVDTTDISLILRDGSGKAIAVIPHPDQASSKALAESVMALASLKAKVQTAKKDLANAAGGVTAQLDNVTKALGDAFPELVNDAKAKVSELTSKLDQLEL